MIDRNDGTRLGSLAGLIGQENVRVDAESCLRAGSSWSPLLAKARATGIATVPSAVALPADTREVASIVTWANEMRTPLYPIGGGSNRVGSTEASGLDADGVAVDLSRLRTLDWDEESLLVSAGAGWTIGSLENRLSEHDYTLGQLPQSVNLLTVGGAIAADAIGIFSGKYGRQSSATLAVTAVLPTGTIVTTKSSPTGSAYFDIQNLLIGAEGVFGIITEATLRMHTVPESRAWAAFTFASFDEGIDALRLVYRSDARPAAARLLDAGLASALLAHYSQAAALPVGTVLLLLGFEGDEIVQTGNFQLAYAVCRQLGGEPQDTELGERWLEEHRTSSMGMAANGRPGGLSDVFSLSASYSSLKAAQSAVRRAIAPYVMSQSAQIVAGYENGAALEVAFEAQSDSGAQAAVALYNRIVDAGLDAALAAGASIAHHYGVGQTRRKHFAAERGPEYMQVLRAMKRALDPNDILNPGRI